MSRILIIEDEEPLRRLLRSMLEREGHTVFDASDGRRAMTLWRTEPVDIVVTDIYMPGQDGIEVISEMKDCTQKPKIIAMSGGGQHSLFDLNQMTCLLGADRFIWKPFNQGTFLLAVREVLNGQTDATNAAPPPCDTGQRKHKRFPVSFPVSFGDGVSTQSGTVVDISREGCRIRCADTVSTVQYFQVEVRLDEPHDKLNVDLAVMRWSRVHDIGIEFIRMVPQDQARLRRLIQGCEDKILMQGADRLPASAISPSGPAAV